MCDLESRVRLAKSNEEAIHKIMEQWSKEPLYQRKEDKNSSLLNLEVHTCILNMKCVFHSLF